MTTKTQTVHVAVPLELLRQVRALAHWDKRSLSAQALWLMERGLGSISPTGPQKKGQ